MSVFETGNVAREPNGERGWIMGAFMPESSPFFTRDFEVGLVRLQRGDAKPVAAANAKATTLTILIHGVHRLIFPGRETVVLSREGDYVLYGPGVMHRWEAVEDSLVLTVRWPSIPTDQETPIRQSLARRIGRWIAERTSVL